jgi:serine/threonine-protein kinase RsbW
MSPFMRKPKQVPGEKGMRVEIPSRLEELSRVEKLAQKIAKTYCVPPDKLDNLAIAITEAVGNAILHGNKLDPDKIVVIQFRMDGVYLRIDVEDQGRGFDPDSLRDPLLPENLMKESGRGVFILKSLMDDIRFSFSPNGTVVHMALKLRDEAT